MLHPAQKEKMETDSKRKSPEKPQSSENDAKLSARYSTQLES